MADPPTGAAGTDGPALQTAISDAVSEGKQLRLFPGTYVFSTMLEVLGRINIRGVGADQTRLQYTGAATAFRVRPSAGENTFYVFEDFCIEPSVVGAGVHGMEWLL